MASSFSASLSNLFNAPIPHPRLHIIKELKASYPHAQHVSVAKPDPAFPLVSYLATLGITPQVLHPETHSILDYNNQERRLESEVIVGVSTFTYSATNFTSYSATWASDCSHDAFVHLVFDGKDDSIGKTLVQKVFEWAHPAGTLRDAVWVYEDSWWKQSTALYKAIRAADPNEIVLDSALKEGLRDRKSVV